MAIHERVWEQGTAPRRRPEAPQAWRPLGSYTLLGLFVGVFLLQWLAYLVAGLPGHHFIFTIDPEWYLHPWQLVTSTLAHDPFNLSHILFNGLVFFFFGPILERLLGTKRFLVWFFVSGAIAGIVQVSITGGAALGASGAIMMVFGALVVIMPNEKLLIWGVFPLPFWAAGIGYALLDIVGAFNPNDGIGNFAHLTGLAIGLWLGWDTRKRLAERGYRF